MSAFLATALVLVAIPVTSHASFGNQTLQKGMWHEDVKKVQEYLMTKGLFPYHTPTGYFGSITEDAVIEFQEKYRLQVDGIVGSETKRSLQVIRPGDMGKHVSYIQHQLKDLGYYRQAVDGIYGSGTASSVREFQQDNGLAVDGIAGPKTRTALNKQSDPKTHAGKTLTVESTAYTADCQGCSGITRMGINLNKYKDAKVIAVDPRVIPLGSVVEVEGYGRAIAADTGGAVKGELIDVFIPDEGEARQWGRQKVQVRIIE
ncbi:peptidoglycan-binding protein [Caldalkalibacillus uzonensis]|uniref:peptidoglycan-binding protein n=1 Tax=Caldalkalibacillus uzonensis TaxID=353224 RepID=UPI0027D7716D|nr:peptidoglycan-binding protein [Caldalkalibacillus uzonensis]